MNHDLKYDGFEFGELDFNQGGHGGGPLQYVLRFWWIAGEHFAGCGLGLFFCF